MNEMILNATPFPTVETDRLRLREITENDVGSIYEYLSDDEVMQYFGLDTFTSIEDALGEISWYRDTYNANKGIRWGITLKEPANVASQKLAEKNGFLREGLLRKYEYSRGKFDDLYMYSLLKEVLHR